MRKSSCYNPCPAPAFFCSCQPINCCCRNCNPVPEFPTVVCTPAFESFSDQLLQVPDTAVVIPNAFNSNDGPAPYTVLSAAFMDLQLPLQGTTFTPLGGNDYALFSTIAPMVQVAYRDGNGSQRAKIVQATMQLTGTVTSPVAPSNVIWWAFMESGSISNPLLSGTTLRFTAAAAIDVIAIPSLPHNFGVLQDYTCSQAPPVQAQCRELYPLESYCRQSSVVSGSPLQSIPFAPLGPTPYSNPSVVSQGGQPYVLRVVSQAVNVTLIDLAFPVLLSYTDGSGQVQRQSTFLFMSLLISDVANVPYTRIIADLSISNVILPSTVTPPALMVYSVMLTGSISAIDDKIDVLTTDAVECGDVPVSVCNTLRPAPTAEITI